MLKCEYSVKSVRHVSLASQLNWFQLKSKELSPCDPQKDRSLPHSRMDKQTNKHSTLVNFQVIPHSFTLRLVLSPSPRHKVFQKKRRRTWPELWGKTRRKKTGRREEKKKKMGRMSCSPSWQCEPGCRRSSWLCEPGCRRSRWR